MNAVVVVVGHGRGDGGGGAGGGAGGAAGAGRRRRRRRRKAKEAFHTFLPLAAKKKRSPRIDLEEQQQQRDGSDVAAAFGPFSLPSISPYIKTTFGGGGGGRESFVLCRSVAYPLPLPVSQLLAVNHRFKLTFVEAEPVREVRRPSPHLPARLSCGLIVVVVVVVSVVFVVVRRSSIPLVGIVGIRYGTRYISSRQLLLSCANGSRPFAHSAPRIGRYHPRRRRRRHRHRRHHRHHRLCSLCRPSIRMAATRRS